MAVAVGTRRYEAVFFDLGYTLVYFEPPQAVLAQQALHAAGAERSLDDITAAVEAVYGESYREAATATFPATPEHDRENQARLEQAILRRLGLELEPSALQLYAETLESFFSRPGVLRPYPEVVEVLTALQGHGYRLGIVSNWSWNLRQRVAQVELERFFEVLWASAYAGCSKPHPGIFCQALDRLPPPAVPPNQVLYVGDSYGHDVVGARNAGMHPVLVDRTPASAPRDCPVIPDLWGLLDLL